MEETKTNKIVEEILKRCEEEEMTYKEVAGIPNALAREILRETGEMKRTTNFRYLP